MKHQFAGGVGVAGSRIHGAYGAVAAPGTQRQAAPQWAASGLGGADLEHASNGCKSSTDSTCFMNIIQIYIYIIYIYYIYIL